MSDPLGLLSVQRPTKPQDDQDPLGLLTPQAAPPAAPLVDPGGNIDLGDTTAAGGTPAPRRDTTAGATTLPPDHPAHPNNLGLYDRFTNAMNKWRDEFVPTETRTVAQPVDRSTVAQQAEAARAQGSQLLRTAASADVSGTPGAQIVPAPGGGTTTAAALDASKTMASLQTQADQQQQFSPQEWMRIAKRGMELGSALHAQGKHDEAQDVLTKAYNAQLLATGAKQADTFGAIALSNMLGIVKDPYAQQRKNMATIRANPSLTFTPEEQQSMLGMNVPAATDRGTDVSKDVLAPLVGMAPLFELGGFAGRGAAAIAGAGAERLGYEGIGKALGRAAQIEEPAAMVGPSAPVRTLPLARTRLEEEVASLRQQLPQMVGRGATQGQVIGGIDTYRQARQQGATPEQALAAAAEGMAMQVPMGAAAEVGLGLTGRLAGFGYDPIARAWKASVDRVRGTTNEEAALSFHPAPAPAVDAIREREGKLPTADMMPGLHRDIAAGLDELLGQRRGEAQQNYEDIFAEPHPIERPAGEDFWQNLPPEERPMALPGEQPLGPEEPPESLIERPNYIGRDRPAAEPVPTALEAAMRRAGVEPGVRLIDESNAHFRMRRASMDADEATRMASEQAQQALNDPNLRLEMAAQAAPGEKQGPLTLGQTLARAGRDADAGEPLASEYKQAINNYVDAAAAVKDAGEAGPNTRSQIALARAKAALDLARTKYGKQIGASAVLALAANNSDLDDEEKKWVGLGGLAILSTDVARMDEAHPLIERVPFYSRLSKAVEALPKKWDNPAPAGDWIGKLKGTTTFKKEELALILPALEEAQRNKVKLSRDDIRAIANERIPQVERITLAAGREGPMNHEGAVGDIIDFDELEGGNHPPAVYDEQAQARRERADEIESEIESDIEHYESEMSGAEQEVDSQYRRLRDRIDEAGLDRSAIDDAIEHIDERVEAENVPRGVVDAAMDKIADNLYEASSVSPDEALRENGYTWAEEDEPPPEPKRQVEVIHRGESEHPMAQRGPSAGYGETKWRTYLDDGRIRDRWATSADRPDEDYIAKAREIYGDTAEIRVIDNADEIANFEPDPGNREWVVRDSRGKEIARDADEQDALQRAVDEEGLGSGDHDELYSDVKSLLQDYAEARASYQAAESEHYWRSEGEAYDEQRNEIDTLRREADELEQMHSDAIDAQIDLHTDERGEFPPNTPGDMPADPNAPPPEEPEQNIIPQVHGRPQFSTYQRIGGGTNYREMLNVWSNKPSDPYTGGHWGEYQNTIGSVRAEDHVVRAATSDIDAAVAHVEGDPEVIRTTKGHVIEKRKARDKILAEMSALVREYEALPEAEQGQAHGLARKYAGLNQQSIDIGNRIDELLGKLADLKGSLLQENEPPPKKVAVMLETQSDWSQDATKYGIREPVTPPDPEKLRQMTEAAETARAEYDRLNEVYREKNRAYSDVGDRLGDLLYRPLPGEQKILATRFQEAVRDINEAMPSGESQLSYTAPSIRDLADPAWEGEWKLLRQLGGDEANRLLDEAEAAQREWTQADHERSVALTRRDELRTAARDYGNPEAAQANRVPPSPFIDSQAVVTLNAARFLMDSAERGHTDIAWSDSANRIKNAHLPMQAAILNYDELTPAAMKRLFNAVGFKDVKIDKLFIKGEGHWHIELTPEMRKAIRRAGLPLLGVAAMTALPQQAEAQGTGGSSKGDLYATAIGGFAAGAAILYLATSRQGRRLLKENEELRKALMVDDLSGLANKTAFQRALPSVNADEKFHWVVFDGDRFKKLNDSQGHAAGDRAIQHFGKAIRDVADEMKIPMRGFRTGGDEFAFAAPVEHAAEFQRRVEARSRYTEGDIETKMTGGSGPTYDTADTQLNTTKEANRRGDSSLRRTPPLASAAIPEDLRKIVDEAADKAGIPRSQGVTFYANPIGPALKELAKYPAAASIAAIGGLATQSDDPDIRATGKPLLALAALSAIGSRRIGAAKDFLADKLLQQMQKSEEGTAVARFFNPDALLHPDVRQAILDYEHTRAKGAARAAEFSGRSKELGPQGDRAVSDVIENEGWEDVSNMSPKDMTAVLTVAASLQSEFDKLARDKVAGGVLDQGQLLPDYAGPRRYAHYEAADVLGEKRGGGTGGASTRIGAQKSRTLDEPIRDAQRALAEAQQAGDPKAIQDAQDALDQAKAVQMSQRVERGEIRESSYRAAQGIEKGYADVAAAKLFQTLRAHPDVAHPEWVAAVDDLQAAKKLRAAATTPADRQAAADLIRDAKVKIDEITRKFQQKGGDYVSLPDTPGLGALRGAVVQRDVANSLQGFATKGLYPKLLRAWKNVKTIFNPGTHAANIISNITFAHMEGLPLWEQPVWLKRAAEDMRAYGPMTRALAENGVLGHNAVNAEGAGAVGRSMKSEEGLTELLGTTRPETADVLRKQGITEARAARASRKRTARYVAGGALLGAGKMYDDEDPGASAAMGAALGAGFGYGAARFGRAITRAYGSEDDIFRVAIGMRHMERGMSLTDATREAGNALGNFRSRSPALQVLRSSVAPFILYPAKVLPRFASQVVDHPWRYLTLIALWGGLNEYSQKQEGEVPDIDVPPGQRRLMGYFLPGFTQLPMRGNQGERAAVDVGRWTPMSAVTSGAPPGSIPAAFDEHTPDVFRAGGPVVDLAAKFGANIDPFTQKQVYRADYPPRENIRKLLNDVSGTMLPSALDFHATNIKEDIQNRDIDKLKNDALGPTGLRPRFIRPGANARSATYELQESLSSMKQDLQKDLIANKNPARVAVIQDRYLRRVQQALSNYRHRLGVEPPADLVRQATQPNP